MVLDYLIIPVVNVIYGAPAQSAGTGNSLQCLGGDHWCGNDRADAPGIRWTARTNQVLLAAMCAVIVAFVVTATRYLFRTQGSAGLLSLAPFYDPATFDFRSVCTATSFAAAAYIGFDGITTLAEDGAGTETHRAVGDRAGLPGYRSDRRIQVYLAQRVAPDSQNFTNVETAFMDIAAQVGGPWLFNAIAAVMAVACVGSGLTGGRLRSLYGIGRDNVLPRAVFGRLDARHAPMLNIWLIG